MYAKLPKIKGKRGLIPFFGAAAAGIAGAAAGLFTFAKDGLNAFMLVIPTPVKIIMFFFFILTFGTAIQNFVLNGQYACVVNDDGTTSLYQVREYNACFDQWATAWSVKHDISALLVNESSAGNLTQIQGEALNGTALAFQEGIHRISLGGQIESILNAVRNLVVWFQEPTVDNFLNYIRQPQDLSCGRLALCLTDQGKQTLGLNTSCSIDQVPEHQQYSDATQTLIPQGAEFENTEEIQDGIFRVQCTQQTEPPSPVHTFFGFEYLNITNWLLLFLIFYAVVAFRKWGEYLG